MESYMLDLLFHTKWVVRDGGEETARLRFYPATRGGTPLCAVENPPLYASDDVIQDMNINPATGAILYTYDGRTYVHKSPTGTRNPIGVLALVSDSPGICDPIMTWAPVSEGQLMEVSVTPTETVQMIPARLFDRRFGTRGSLPLADFLPEQADDLTRRCFDVVDKTLDLASAMTLPQNIDTIARTAVRLVPTSRSFDNLLPAVSPAALAPTPVSVPAEPAYHCYVLGSLLGTTWQGSPEPLEAGIFRPEVEVFFEPRLRGDGTPAVKLPQIVRAVGLPGVTAHVRLDHVEVEGPGFTPATSYWEIPETHLAPLGALILWCSNWRSSPHMRSPLYLAYPIYDLYELHLDGVPPVPVVTTEALEECFCTAEAGRHAMAFGDLRPIWAEDGLYTADSLSELAGRAILMRMSPSPYSREDSPHQAFLVDNSLENVIRDAAREKPEFMTLIPSETPAPETPPPAPATAVAPAANEDLVSQLRWVAETLQAVVHALDRLRQAMPADG